MECPESNTIFDYINKELSEDIMITVEKHLASCEKCHELYHRMNIQIQSVRSGLDLLSPDSIPELPFSASQKVKKSSQGFISGFFRQPLKISVEITWVKASVLAFLILIFFSVFTLRKDQKISENDLQRILMVEDIFYNEDPKVDLNGKKMVIIIFDQEKNTFELVKADMNKGETSSEQFKVNKKNSHLDI